MVNGEEVGEEYTPSRVPEVVVIPVPEPIAVEIGTPELVPVELPEKEVQHASLPGT